MNVLLSLGLFPFSVATLAHDEFARKTSWRHANVTRVGARDALQFTGPGEDQVTLPGTAYAELSDGRASLDQLRAMADAGAPWPLVDGVGRVLGSYVIVTVDERQSEFFPDGTPRRIDFTVELLRVDDPAGRAGAFA